MGYGSGLTSEEVHEDDMRGVASLLVRSNISEYKEVEFSIISDTCADARDRKEDNPREDPDREKYFDHHSKKAYEEVSIKSVSLDDGPIVGLVNCERP